MKDIKIRRLVFEMERIALQHRISNSEVDFREDFDGRGIIVDMTRRIAVTAARSRSASRSSAPSATTSRP